MDAHAFQLAPSPAGHGAHGRSRRRTNGGDWVSGGTGTQDVHPYDADESCGFSDTEVLALAAAWGDGEVDDTILLEGVAAWGKAPDPYC